MALDSERQTWRNLLKERVELILLSHCGDNFFEVLTDLLTQALSKLDILHGSVGSIDDRLFLGTTPIHLTNEDSQLSENVSLHNGSRQVADNHENQLVKFFGS